MSDVELLFLVLALIYVWECAYWVPGGSTAFHKWFGSRWKQAEPMLRNQKGGFVFAPFLPPLGTILSCHRPPVLLSPQAILIVMEDSEPPREAIRFDDLEKVQFEGKKVRLTNRASIKVPSVTLARSVAEGLRDLKTLSPAARENALQKSLRESFDLKNIRTRWADFLARTRSLQLLANVLFFYLFLFAPFLIWRLGLAYCWPLLLAGIYTLTFAIALSFRRVHKHFFSSAEDDRFTHFLINLFSPASTIRAHDLLSRPLLEEFHPLAIAKVFCPESEFQRLARSTLLEIRYPLEPSQPASDNAARAVENYSRDKERTAVEEFLKKSGVRIDELLRPPTPADDTCRSYCPRCQSQFTVAEGKCPDCGGLELLPFRLAQSQQEKTGKS